MQHPHPAGGHASQPPCSDPNPRAVTTRLPCQICNVRPLKTTVPKPKITPGGGSLAFDAANDGTRAALPAPGGGRLGHYTPPSRPPAARETGARAPSRAQRVTHVKVKTAAAGRWEPSAWLGTRGSQKPRRGQLDPSTASRHVPQPGAGARFRACEAGVGQQPRAQAFPVFQVQGSERKKERGGGGEKKGIKKLDLPSSPGKQGRRQPPAEGLGTVGRSPCHAAPGAAVGRDFCLRSTKSSPENCEAPSSSPFSPDTQGEAAAVK